MDVSLPAENRIEAVFVPDPNFLGATQEVIDDLSKERFGGQLEYDDWKYVESLNVHGARIMVGASTRAFNDLPSDADALRVRSS